MIYTLHRYIFRELCKIFLLATVALTLILSLGSLLRPIQRYGVGPGQVVDLLVYFLPVTMSFVLPIAALFAASLAYGRLATDNEIDACKASGLSPLALIGPGLLLAVLVAVGNLVLSFYITPSFVYLADRSIHANLKQIVFRHLQRQGYYRLPPGDRYAVYADFANEQTDSLHGVIVLKTREGRLDRIMATEVARVWFDPADALHEVRITARNALQMDLSQNDSVQLQNISLGMPFDSPLSDRIRFKRLDDIERIRTDLLRFGPVEKQARQVSAQAMTELLADDLFRTLAADRPYEWTGAARAVRMSAAPEGVSLGPGRTIHVAGPVQVTETDRSTDGPPRRWECEKAVLTLDAEQGGACELTLDLDKVRSMEGAGTVILHYPLTGLAVPGPIVSSVTAPPLLETLVSPGLTAGLSKGPTSQMIRAVDRLRREIRGTLAEIQAEIHSRLVFGIGCVPMILIGMGLGILHRGGHLLTAFAISCVPALILVVGVVSGSHIAKNPGSHGGLGIGLMWAALAVLFGMALATLGRVVRH
ncbi:MAG: LptF/LptG family permease [Phycisphaerae bacterium]|nr:LptF/LptG family permease [Phycisphaerae bacterium]